MISKFMIFMCCVLWLFYYFFSAPASFLPLSMAICEIFSEMKLYGLAIFKPEGISIHSSSSIILRPFLPPSPRSLIDVSELGMLGSECSWKRIRGFDGKIVNCTKPNETCCHFLFRSRSISQFFDGTSLLSRVFLPSMLTFDSPNHKFRFINSRGKKRWR